MAGESRVWPWARAAADAIRQFSRMSTYAFVLEPGDQGVDDGLVRRCRPVQGSAGPEANGLVVVTEQLGEQPASRAGGLAGPLDRPERRVAEFAFRAGQGGLEFGDILVAVVRHAGQTRQAP